ncbi:MAG: shikimate dehydrogenase [Betaproteobacteria bacterium]|nr:shikimate dehydrogenase [Betaproteobacteria bacterium]
MTDRYAIVGHPVAHSKSPQIHALFARETHQDMSYERLLAPVDGFHGAMEAFRRSGAKGGNVTLPFKLEAFTYANDLTERARLAGAVNTLRFDGDRILGDNTDGIGLCADLAKNQQVVLTGARILILGAGGAARGVVGPLLAARPAQLAITNRTHSRAEEVADAFAAMSESTVTPLTLAELPTQRFDLIINATSASLAKDLPPVPVSCFDDGALAYDMMYGVGQTPFMLLAATAGARTADGLGMLVEQAAEAFHVWRGVRPSTGPVIAHLREQLRQA